MHDQVDLRRQSEQFGYSSLTEEQLIALLLRFGSKKASVFRVARDVLPIWQAHLATTYTSNQLKDALHHCCSLTQQHIHVLVAAFELCKRQQAYISTHSIVNGPHSVELLFQFLVKKKQEHVYGVYLSSRYAVIATKLLFKGSVDSVAFEARDLLYYNIKYQSRFVIVVHNHPSGDSSPSKEDITLTQKLKLAAEMFSVVIVDHIIIARTGYYSFKESGNML